MWAGKSNKLNPNPITKFFVVGLLSLTVLHSIYYTCEWAIIFIISIMYFINGFRKDAVKNIIFFAVLFLVPNFKILAQLPFIIKMFFSLIFVLRMFYLPYAAGKFLIRTSDVGSIISSMDVLRIPNVMSIPVSVMFRFFPSFIEEKRHIKMAMKIRGIKTKNPLKYLEHIAVPLLIISSNIADDISKAAETKCIANPIKKTRYVSVGVKVIDFVYGLTITGIVIGGWLCLK
ncbi:energy-coupling factor transporter transmembrane component T [Mediterraneibacter gnavus]|uniref:energy-coupling factor transporter transmembrane component T n=1 Tax=Mediterraneibacter gnavus TaxID=33038 RepID=UPI00232D7698|nr:energy-coupling factor transporter transmembrane component T [Mediterraneibacter gnavus]MDB8711921.1 energy-coupling factor transporter transmembrane component T [Mediterraneibacter gnavus]MDB8714985.1 energy-coupling factor transporter transmembrane component T [Mediterraneibacter gnavus]